MNGADPPLPGSELELAEQAFARAQWSVARDLARRHLESSPRDARAWCVLGYAELECGGAPAAAGAFDRAIALDPDDPEPHCGQADLRGRGGELGVAASIYDEVLRRWPDYAPAALMLGHARRALGDTDAAGAAFVRAGRAWPESQDAIQLALACAAELAERATPPPLLPDAGSAVAPLSLVICSITPSKLANVRTSLARALAGADWELIHVGDARSLCEGYNRGLARVRGDIVVFCHDDIDLLVDRLQHRLADALRAADVVGVAGTTRLTGPSWMWSGAPHAHGWIAHARPDGRISARAYSLAGPGIGAIEALDGVFIACRRDVAARLHFDDATFDHFHLYDTDFSYRAHRAGLRVMVRTDIRLLHHSGGGRDSEHWRPQAERFLAKHDLPPPGPAAPAAGADATMPDITSTQCLFAWLEHWQRIAPAPP